MARKKLAVGQQQFGFPDEDIKASLHDEIVIWLKNNAETVCKRLVGWQDNWEKGVLDRMKSQLLEGIDKRKNLLVKDIQAGEIWGSGADTGMHLYQIDRAKRLQEMKAHLQYLQSFKGLGDPPPPAINVSKPRWERPIIRERYKTTDIVGYIDLKCSVQTSRLAISGIPSDHSGRPTLEQSGIKWWTYFDEAKDVAFDAKTTIPSLGELFRALNTYRVFENCSYVVVSPEARFTKEISDEGFGFIQYPEGEFFSPVKLKS